MLTHAEIVSTVMTGKKLIVKKEQSLLLTALTQMVQSQREDTLAILLSMKGKHFFNTLLILPGI